MCLPKISVVIPSYNQGKYIGETITSLLNQDYENKEIIIIDGGSNDESIVNIKKHEDQITYWVSEKDRGQSHAINKGFRLATGTLLTWLNSDDILLPGSLKAVADIWHINNQPDWIAGNCVWSNPEGKILRCARGIKWSNLLAKLGLVNVSGPSSFFSRNLLEQVGGVQEVHYMMDTDLWLNFAHLGFKYVRLNRYIWVLRLHPEAKMSGHNFKNSPMASKNHSVWSKRQEERDKIDNYYNISRIDRNVARYVSRFIRLMQLATPLAVLDTIRISGIYTILKSPQ